MLYILLAAYNEEGNLHLVFEDIKKLNLSFPYKIVLVNDGSTDRTSLVAGDFQKTLPITVLDHSTNQGLGIALLTGFNFIISVFQGNDLVVVLDADNTHPLSLIPLMKDKIELGYCLVIASRFTTGGKQEGLSLFRKLLSLGASALLKLTWHIKGVNDYSCGYRMYSAKLLKDMVKAYGEGFITERGFGVSIELLLKASRCCSKITEVPLALDYARKQGKSKMKVFETVLRYLVLIYKLKFLRPQELL